MGKRIVYRLDFLPKWNPYGNSLRKTPDRFPKPVRCIPYFYFLKSG